MEQFWGSSGGHAGLGPLGRLVHLVIQLSSELQLQMERNILASFEHFSSKVSSARLSFHSRSVFSYGLQHHRYPVRAQSNSLLQL